MYNSKKYSICLKAPSILSFFHIIVSLLKRLYKNSGRESGTIRYFREVLKGRKVTIDVKHFEDCEQLFMSVGLCYLIEALLEFLKMDNIIELPKQNDPFPPDECSEEEKKAHLLAELDKFMEEYISLEIPTCGKDFDGDCDEDDSGDDDSGDGIFNYGVNLLSSFMLLLDCKHAVASGNGEHLALVQQQMLYHFSSVSGYNSYAIEMLISTIQNEVLLSTAEAHQCKWLH